MNGLGPDELRRGWCPTALRPMETGDGWLVRLHPPGAVLEPKQLIRIAQLARQHGNGLIEISARANLQIRGVSLPTHPALVATLLSERLVEEHDGDGPQRLTLTAPLATSPCPDRHHPEGVGRAVSKDGVVGLRASRTLLRDAAGEARQDEGCGKSARPDCYAVADAIERAGRSIAGLPAKTLVIVDDGGPLSLDGFPCDLRVVAVADCEVAFGLPDGTWRGPVMPSQAAALCTAILIAFAAAHRGAPETVRRLRDLEGDGMAALTAASGLSFTDAPAPRPAPRRVGRFASAGGETALVGLPFGRSDAETLAKLGHAALLAGTNAIRLSPWRGLAFSGLAPANAERLLAAAGALGLIVDPDDPRLSVQACAGKPACLRAEADAMADAAVLADAAAPLLAGGASLHVSGCVKSCAHAGTSDLTFVGRKGGYDVVVAGTTRDEPSAALDLPAILARLRPGQDLFNRVSARGPAGPRD